LVTLLSISSTFKIYHRKFVNDNVEQYRDDRAGNMIEHIFNRQKLWYDLPDGWR